MRLSGMWLARLAALCTGAWLALLGDSPPRPAPQPEAQQTMSSLAFTISSCREALYYRAACGEADKNRCPYRSDKVTRQRASRALLAAQAHLRRIALPDADLDGVDLGSVEPLSFGAFPLASLDKLWPHADLRGTSLREARLANLDLSRADLRTAALSHADLSSTKLVDAKLNGAILSGARLQRADLSGADLRDAELGGADLRDSVGLSEAQLAAARGDASTKLPPDLPRPHHWSL